MSLTRKGTFLLSARLLEKITVSFCIITLDNKHMVQYMTVLKFLLTFAGNLRPSPFPEFDIFSIPGACTLELDE